MYYRTSFGGEYFVKKKKFMYFRASFIGWDIPSKKFLELRDEVCETLAKQALKDMEDYIPYRNGEFFSHCIRLDGRFIRFEADHAPFLYNGMVQVDPYTGSPFADRGCGKVSTTTPLNYTRTTHAKVTDHWFEPARDANLKKWMKIAEEEWCDLLNK